MKYNINDPVNRRLSDIELDLKRHTHDVASLRQSMATNGQVLTWSDTQRQWIPATPSGGPGGGATVLNDLFDVTITSPANNQILVFNSSTSQWVNQSPPTVITDHGALTGLGDDDHTQYHTDARGDARYSLLGHTHPQSDITNLVTDLAGKAPLSHTHPQSDITNLVTDLAGKAPLSHTHDPSDINDGGASSGDVLEWSGLSWVPVAPTVYAAIGHTHPQSDITNLVTDLAGKAPLSHTHPQSDITNLVTDLAGKAPLSHTHPLSDLQQSSATTGMVPTWNGSAWVAQTPAGGGAPVGASYIVKTADATLTNEFALGTLSTGILKVTTSTGDLSVAVGTDLPADIPLNYLANSGASAGDVIMYNGILNAWSVGTVSGSTGVIDDLLDVDTTSTTPTNGDVLTWNNTTGNWEPAAPTGGGGGGSDETALVWMFGG